MSRPTTTELADAAEGTGPAVDGLDVRVYKVPTDRPEGDGTLAWSSTTVVVVTVRAGGAEGLGYSYTGAAAASVISEKLSEVVTGADPLQVPALNQRMVRECRNLGGPGVVACAVSAVDTALWDLKARLLGLPLADLFGRCRAVVPIYGSGGFTTYPDDVTRAQVHKWVDEWAIPRVKIKIGESWGTQPARDLHRVRLVRETAGPDTEVYVDANGAYTAKQAIRLGRAMAAEADVTWFEEPVSSDDLGGLAAVRQGCPLDVAAGEYGYTQSYFWTMLTAGAVDCLQIDVTRCGGYTGWLRAAACAESAGVEVSGHCAPNLHAHVGVSAPNLRHLEYFHDHHRIENMLFDGALPPDGGSLRPSRDAPGHGLALRGADAEQFRVA
ncbi:MAG TPA: enolase C-terminal domain-like protein [Acidimicrobiales bacterium]|nr:enolase C-terminal domain-like protein [Acidimicrobiales bacterium]